MKVIFIGGLTNGELIVDYLIRLKKIDLKLIITHPKNHKIQSYRNFSKFRNKCEIVRNLNALIYYKKIKNIKPDLIIVSGWSWIIPKKILITPRIGAVGFHPSDLPRDRGRSVLAWQIEEGYTQTALTMFIMKEGVDSGDIIGKRKIQIKYKDTIKDILLKCDKASLFLIKKYLIKILNGKIKTTKQDEKKATYRKMRDSSNSEIIWSDKTVNIYNKIRAISYPYPGAYFKYKNIKYLVKKSKVIRKNKKYLLNNLRPGTLIKSSGKYDHIFKTSDGYLEITTYEEIE